MWIKKDYIKQLKKIQQERLEIYRLTNKLYSDIKMLEVMLYELKD